MAAIDLTGHTYGQLTVLEEVLPQQKPRKWRCMCSCGNTHETLGTSLRNGRCKSCGCLHIATNKKMFTKHSAYKDKLYHVYLNIFQRCNNPNYASYPLYGGRGITICAEWKDYLVFKEWAETNGYVEGVTLDRTDTNKGYSPDNCRWVDRVTQSRNRRKLSKTTSQYIGVSWSTDRKKWVAAIGLNGKTIPVGRFTSELEAAIARDTYIKEQGLKDFVLNFT